MNRKVRSDNRNIKVQPEIKSVEELLNSTYTIDFYQRDYKWQREHVEELLSDFEEKFSFAYEENHSTKDVKQYPHYFLGSMIISVKDATHYIVDGQQRLTTLTLLLIYLYHLLKKMGIDEKEREKLHLQNMIYSSDYGEMAFRVNIEERESCMNSLFENEGKSFERNGAKESVLNILDRYDDISELFPESLRGEALLHFTYWLKGNVDLIRIIAYSNEEAYSIFETMNDRGLRLSDSEMLKGYLLSRINDDKVRTKANKLWQDKIFNLIRIKKEEDLDFFKAWFRSKYAKSIRYPKKDAKNQDFEEIGRAFHKWLKENESSIGLLRDSDYPNFVLKNFDRFANAYTLIRKASVKLTPGFESIYYNEYLKFSLQYPLLLSPIHVNDNEETALKKIRLVATYIEIYIARGIVNYAPLRFQSIKHRMFELMKNIRNQTLPNLVNMLRREVGTLKETFEGISNFQLRRQNSRHIRYLLARITNYIENESGKESDFYNYISTSSRRPMEIEHIWADKYEYHVDEFNNTDDFERVRNMIGALILLPKGFNQSYGALPYEKKLPHYLKHNLLAQSLNKECYDRNPDFQRFIRQSKLPFEFHPHFKTIDVLKRQQLYQAICEKIWDPARLDREAQA